MQEIGARGTAEHRERMMKHALEEYDEQFGENRREELEEEEEIVNHPSASSGIKTHDFWIMNSQFKIHTYEFRLDNSHF